MRKMSSRRILLIASSVLGVALALAVLVPVIGPWQAVSAANDGPISIPGPEVIIRAIPNTGEGFFVSPPPASMRLSPNAPEAATINVTYNGFSAEAQTAFQYAVDIWAGLLDSSVTINIIATWTPLDTGVLGSAGSASLYGNFSGAPALNTWFPNALADKRACGNVGGEAYDIVANFNSTFPDWYFGTVDPVPFNKWDFVTVVLHEIGHGLGFAGSFTTVSAGIGRWDSSLNVGIPAIYTRFVRDGAGTAITSYTSPSAALATTLQGGTSGVFWTGRFGTAGNSGVQPTLYSPNPWEQGSSFSHFNQATYETELMKPALPNGVAIHTPGTRTLGVLRDIGWGDELVIQAYGYNTTGVVEWVQLRNNASVSVNLSDYAIGDEEDRGAVDEGMFMLPNVDVAPGTLFTMRVRSDGSWATAYPGDPNPTYCWNCTSGYTNLTNYSLWGGTTGDLNNAGDEIVLLRTNGGTTDPDGTIDDFIIDAMCYGTGQPYVDTDGGGSLNNRDKTIFTDGICLGLLPSGSFKRSSTVEACVPSTALVNNPTAVSIESFSEANTTVDQSVPAIIGLLSVAALFLLVGGLVVFRTRPVK
jgi:hypothetical protein